MVLTLRPPVSSGGAEDLAPQLAEAEQANGHVQHRRASVDMAFHLHGVSPTPSELHCRHREGATRQTFQKATSQLLELFDAVRSPFRQCVNQRVLQQSQALAVERDEGVTESHKTKRRGMCRAATVQLSVAFPARTILGTAMRVHFDRRLLPLEAHATGSAFLHLLPVGLRAAPLRRLLEKVQQLIRERAAKGRERERERRIHNLAELGGPRCEALKGLCFSAPAHKPQTNTPHAREHQLSLHVRRPFLLTLRKELC
eukprot:CAMPEP_0117466214 /NCGR_PEP_ID=MMETSP0784-20121206/5027_1 /TAXON_ID=39447 /ORGANISM="" /LENGTH=256 /DNA_ID=CAMNT_0005260149 /DNA_START=255 /DNA_END=1024 /DNA_ORIENTATION=+